MALLPAPKKKISANMKLGLGLDYIRKKYGELEGKWRLYRIMFHYIHVWYSQKIKKYFGVDLS